MARVLSSACVVLLLLCVGGRAWAGKPPVAILGLEVFDNGSGIDPETTRAAKELTAALRDRAKAGTGPYQPVPGGEKELIDEKLLNNCDSEAPTCMAAIGNELGAEILIYGRIEKQAQNGQPIYKVSLKVFNVARKQMMTTMVETVPAADATGGRAPFHARTWYAKLSGTGAGGTLVIKANIDRGTVLLDDDTKGNLTSGMLTLSNVAEGKHKLVIEGANRARYEEWVNVRNGETVNHAATLADLSIKKPPPDSSGPVIDRSGSVTESRSNPWKPVFYASAALEAGAIGFTVYEWLQARSNAKKIDGNYNQGSCDNSAAKAMFPALKDACDNYSLHKVGWIVSGAVGVAVVGSFVMAFVRDSGSSEKSAATGHRKRRELAITPIVTPNGGGATLRFDW